MILGMNKMPIQKRAQILNLLVEGNSLRATARIADCSLNTITRLLVDVGGACSRYQDEHLRNLNSKRLQLDEIWSFVAMKDKRVPADLKGTPGMGDTWTWTAIDADSKLIVSWMVGDRTATAANIFVHDLAARLANRVQITTDGLALYVDAIAGAFKRDVDYAMLIKQYGEASEGQKRYSPAVCTGIKKKAVFGDPDMSQVSTSYVERQNLTMRMGMRRFTRLTNGFSKKIEAHIHAISLHFMHYNFARIHKTLRVTPAMQAGVTDHVWTLEEIAALAADPVARKRGPYKKSSED
jgi:IS1 family transposase